MQIKIIEKNKLLSSNYEIYVRGKLKYHISGKGAFSILDNDERVQLVAKKKWNPIRIYPKMALSDLVTSKEWILDFKDEMEFSLNSGDCTINFYQQIGRKVGLFKDNIQVGFWDKGKLSKHGNDKYELELDNDLEGLPLIAVVIAYNRYLSTNNNDTLYYYDYGNLNIEPKQSISSNWTPKK